MSRFTFDFFYAISPHIFPFGSVPLKTYLLDGDIDLIAFGMPNSEDVLANEVHYVLELEEQNKDAEFEVKNAEFEVNDVQYIHAEVFCSNKFHFIFVVYMVILIYKFSFCLIVCPYISSLTFYMLPIFVAIIKKSSRSILQHWKFVRTVWLIFWISHIETYDILST